MIDAPVGDCFVVAAHLLLMPGSSLELDSNQDAVIVHGTPISQSRDPRYTGKRYWHAWIEVITTHEYRGNTFEVVECLDYSNGLSVRVPQLIYYREGQITEEHVWRFDITQARYVMLDLEHYGPWVDDWEEVTPL